MSVRRTDDLGPDDVEIGQEWYRMTCQHRERRRCRVVVIDADDGKVLMQRVDDVADRRWESMGNLLARWTLVAEATVAP